MSHEPVVLVTDSEFGNLEFEEDELRRAGVTLKAAQCRTEADLIREGSGASGLLVQYASITSSVLVNLKHLVAVARYGVGVDTIDIAAASAQGVAVINVPDYGEAEVSDHTLALLLACNRRLALYIHLTRSGNWDYKMGLPVYALPGRRLGLIGFGRIARAVARKAKAFGLEVVTYDPYVDSATAGDFAVELLTLHEVLEGSHFVSLHVPLSPSTRHIINADSLSRMRHDAYLINTARGGLVDEEALALALREGWIAGAALDVLEQEPIVPRHPFANLKNIIMTPHVAWHSNISEETLRRRAASSLAAVLHGSLNGAHIVNLEDLNASAAQERRSRASA